MRAGVTWSGVAVLILGLIVLGAGWGYANVASEATGGVLSVIGIIVGAAGAAMKPKVHA